ncbi:hypothetical protein BGZ82_003353 [Podila clonocystis]|nr:hypothetical protein BGZ82_003353 [Podila clonocystis]
MSFHPSNPEANKRSSPDGFDTNHLMALALPLGLPPTPASIRLRDQETIRTLQQGFEPAQTETFFSEVDNASDPVLLQDMALWSPSTSSLAASEIRAQGNPTPTSSSVPVLFSEARLALFAGSAPRQCLGSSSPTNPNQGVALANSLNRLRLMIFPLLLCPPKVKLLLSDHRPRGFRALS